MSPRQKKPLVKPEKRQEWLERNECGESPPKIADADGFDARTVRKHIEIAKQDRETKEARASVLRNALERHYADLCRYAESLGRRASDRHSTEFNMKVSSPVPYEQQMGIALRQHLPRSPIWGYLSQRVKMYGTKDELTRELGKKIESSISSDSRLLTDLTEDEKGVKPGIVAALTAQATQWVLGSAGLNVEDNLISEPAEDSFVNLRYGAFPMGKVRKEHVELVGESLTDWTALIKEWEEYRKLEKAYREIERVEKDLVDEIAVIALRRVVPGRCRYCPL